MLFYGFISTGVAFIILALLFLWCRITISRGAKRTVGVWFSILALPVLLLIVSCVAFYSAWAIGHQDYHQLADGTYDLLAVRVDAEDNQVLRLDIRSGSGDTIVTFTSPFTENLEGGVCNVCGRSTARTIQRTHTDEDRALIVQDGAWTLRLSEADLAMLEAQGYQSHW